MTQRNTTPQALATASLDAKLAPAVALTTLILVLVLITVLTGAGFGHV